MKTSILKSFILIATMFVAGNLSAYDFSAENEDGVTIFYKIITDNTYTKTCAVTFKEEHSYDNDDETFYDYTGKVIIPEYANGYKVESITENAFRNCKELTSVQLPNSVRSIARCAFQNCSNLTTVNIPESITSIPEYTFYNCSSISSIILPNTVRYIGRAAFCLCSSMKSINLNNSITTIYLEAFLGCSSLTSINIPTSLKTIEYAAFARCSGLKSVTIPSSVTTIREFGFERCSSLTSFTLPKTVTKIEKSILSCCSGLTRIVVEEGNPNYHSDNNCNAIIDKNTNTLMAGCRNTVIPNTVTSIAENAFRESKLTSLVIPNSVKSIGGYAFTDCKDLTTINLPDSIQTLEIWLFHGCTSLTSITIPNSVTKIEANVFYGCSSMESITSYITNVFETGYHPFYGCTNATLYVPMGLVDTYKSLLYWNEIRKIEEIPSVSLLLACNTKGKVLINNNKEFTNDVDYVSLYSGTANTFAFTPEKGCELEQVTLDGLDITPSVKDNKLSTIIRENSKMNVVFSAQNSDINKDGNVDISDVTKLVQIILGN